MICPKCKSSNTKKVSVMDEKHHIGHQRCMDCKFQCDWTHFCGDDETLRAIGRHFHPYEGMENDQCETIFSQANYFPLK